MPDSDIEARSKDFAVVGGKLRERRHHGSRGERNGHPSDPAVTARAIRIQETSLNKLHRYHINEALSAKPQAEAADDPDIDWDPQALREAELASQGDAGGNHRVEEPIPLAGAALRKARREAAWVEQVKKFGKEPRKI